jgi:hypothetical protein
MPQIFGGQFRAGKERCGRCRVGVETETGGSRGACSEPVGRRRGDTLTGSRQDPAWTGNEQNRHRTNGRTERVPPSGREKERAGRDFGVKR